MAAGEQDVGGIALGLTLDTSGWSSGIARAKADLEGLKRSAGSIEIGVGVQTRGQRGGGAVPVLGGPAAVGGVPGSATAAGVVVNPRFQVSAGAVRQLRTEINAQLRAMNLAGEAVAIPIKLGRIPYAALRSEISTGIGEVPIRIKPDAGSLTAFASVLSAMTGQTPGRARQAIESAAASRGIPARAQGGPASGGRPYLVGERGPEIHWPASAGTYIAPRRDLGGGAKRPPTKQDMLLSQYPQALMEQNLRRVAESMTPDTREFGRQWYGLGRKHVLALAHETGYMNLGSLGAASSHDVMGSRALNAAAALSPRNQWFSNLAHAAAAMRGFATGQTPTKQLADSYLPLIRTLLGPNARINAGSSGIMQRELAKAMQALGGAPRELLFPEKTNPKVYPFSGNLQGLLDLLTLDTIASQTATSGSTKWVKGLGEAKSPDPGVFRDAMRRAHENVYEDYKDEFPHIAQFQAALWTHYRGKPFAKGGRVNRYRGGTAFKDMFPRGVDLSLFPRDRRLAVGKALYGVGQQFPFTAASTKVEAITGAGMVGLMGDPFASTNVAGAAGWHRQTGSPSTPKLWLNASMSDRSISGIGGLPKTAADAAVHEFGHALDFVHGIWSDDPSNQSNMAGFGFPSRYASEAPGEHFAELFLRDQRVREMRQRYGSAARVGESEVAAEQFFAGLQNADKARFGELGQVGQAPGQRRLPGFLRRLTGRMAGGPIFKPVDAAAFHAAVSSASSVVRPSGRRVGETVYTYPLDEYAEMRTFLNREGTAGYAIKPDGDLVSVFNVGGPGGGKSALRSAIQRGALKLDAFDELSPTFANKATDPRNKQMNLPKFYERFGFREIGRDPWNPEYAPEGWRGGQPDVVYMARQRKALAGRKRARGGEVDRAIDALFDDDLDMEFEEAGPLEDFDHPIYGIREPSRLKIEAWKASAREHMMGAGWSAEDANEWLANEASGQWPMPRRTPPLVLRTSGGPNANADIFQRLQEESAASAAWLNSPEGQAEIARRAARPDHNVDPITSRLPKGVKIRFSPEWSDYPDPARFIGSGGPMSAPSWANRWTDPGQLTLGYDAGARSAQYGKGPLGELMETLGGYTRNPSFDPFVGEVEPFLKRYGSLGEWLRTGMWGEGGPTDARSRAKLVAYALDQQNKVLAHAMVTATKAVPDYGPKAGQSVDALHPEYVWTDIAARGKGLASAMYSRLEKLVGMPIAPSSSQTPAGVRLWSRPASERSFGRAFRDRKLTVEQEVDLRTQAAVEPYGTNLTGWRAGSIMGAEPVRDFSGAVDPIDRPPRPRRVRGQMRLPGFAGGGFMFKAGRPLDRDALRVWEAQLRETTSGMKEWIGPPSDRRLIDVDPRTLPHKRFDMLDDIWGDRKRAAGGSSEDMGRYIVNEIGRELFVPKRLERLIPPDVAEQIPGAEGIWDKAVSKQDWVREQWDTDAWLARSKAARLRAGGGDVFEIPGDGPTPWSPPEDGWIVPNRLMNRIPRHEGGEAEAGHPHPHMSKSGKRWIDESGQQIPQSAVADALASYNQRAFAAAEANTPRRPKIDDSASELLNEQALSLIQGFAPIPRGGPKFDAEARRQLALGRIYGGGVRGLSGRSAFSGLIQSKIGGGEERRMAMEEARIAEQEIRAGLPKGIDTVDDLANSIGIMGDFVKASEAEISSWTHSTEDLTQAQKQQVQLTRATVARVQDYEDALKRLAPIEVRRNEALAKTQQGAVGNLLSATAAGLAFNAGMQLLQVGMEGATKVLAPIVDQLTGFTAVGQRVTKGLADELPQAGTLQTLMARRGIGAGLGAGQLDFFEERLGGATFAKAGAAAAEQAGEMFRAAMSTAPSGLLGGYGGIGGGGFAAELLGGGKGLLETLAGSAAAARGQTSATGFGAQLEKTGNFAANNPALGAVGMLAGGVGLLAIGAIGTAIDPTQGQRRRSPEEVARERENIEEQVKYFNEATERGRGAAGLRGPGARVEDVGVGSAEAARVLAGNFDDYTKQLAEAGLVFKSASGDLLTTQDEINTAVGDVARGLTVPDKETFARAQAQALSGQRQTAAERGAFERGIAIPGQLGQQVLANPFISAQAGIAEGFEPTLVNLKEIQSLQDEIAADARASVESQAVFIGAELGGKQAAEFRELMMGASGSVASYGEEIAALNEQLASKQAQLSAHQYAFSLKVINRQIRDARGLAGMSGGSELGRIQREQWQLNRESQRLQLESQRLANEMAQRQINFQVAIAGFQAPGITGQERAARMEEAQVEADYAQRQLDLQKSQTGIAGQQFGLEGRAFTIQTQVAVQELEAQRGILVEQRALEQEQIAVQKQLAALAVRQGQVQSKAQSLFAEATGNFDARLNVASGFVAQFGGTMASALIAVRRAIDYLAGRNTQGAKSQGGKDDKIGATGLIGTVLGETGFIAGEAGVEAVAIIRNPKRGEMSSSPGGGSGGGNVVNIQVTGNNISSEMDLDHVARRVAREVEDILSRKASLVMTP